jgi:hypothetical protein
MQNVESRKMIMTTRRVGCKGLISLTCQAEWCEEEDDNGNGPDDKDDEDCVTKYGM